MSSEPGDGPTTPSPESFEDQIYCAVVRPGDVCYDIGANVGDVSVLLARLSGAGGCVVAFEPVWPTYARLCVNARRAGAGAAPIVTVPVGLADKQAETTIQVPEDDYPMASLADAEVWSKVLPERAITRYECTLTTLDRFLQASRLAVPDFVKIDVEGAELLVLEGARRFFEEGHRPLMLIELFAPWERAFGYGPWEVLSLLRDWGYRCSFACPEGLVEHEPTRSAPFPAEYVRGYNVLALDPIAHVDRVDALDGLLAGGTGTILPMPHAPVPNIAT